MPGGNWRRSPKTWDAGEELLMAYAPGGATGLSKLLLVLLCLSFLSNLTAGDTLISHFCPTLLRMLLCLAFMSNLTADTTNVLYSVPLISVQPYCGCYSVSLISVQPYCWCHSVSHFCPTLLLMLLCIPFLSNLTADATPSTLLLLPFSNHCQC